AITDHAGQTLAVALSGRTLYKDGSWNTLCLPFSMTAAQIAASNLAGATIKELNASTSNLDSEGLLTLYFTTAYDPTDAPDGSIVAGKPYIVKWATTGDNISNPTFLGVTISSNAPTPVAFPIENSAATCHFVGQYSPFSIVESGATGDNEGNLNEIILLGSGNTLGYAASTRSLRCFRAHFYVPASGGGNGVKAYQMSFGDEGGETGIISIEDGKPGMAGEADTWYDLSGRRLNGKPGRAGIYIHNGRRVMVK
ncbi:MAG: hypothetical protein IJR87_10735, partial [Bacteroidaceae bacterium]|nr:hypothetical protein [Bacteroidaceae bacterium]